MVPPDLAHHSTALHNFTALLLRTVICDTYIDQLLLRVLLLLPFETDFLRVCHNISCFSNLQSSSLCVEFYRSRATLVEDTCTESPCVPGGIMRYLTFGFVQ